MYFFAPGRTEIIGNHTDHQLGRVIAAPVKQGISAECEKRDDGIVRILSRGFGEICIELARLAPCKDEKGSSAALIRGVAAALSVQGLQTGGFDAEVSSCLKPGGGLSSSAAFSVLVGRIFSGLYNNGEVDFVTIAKCAQSAENKFFDKPSGLMDQLACSLGGAAYIDLRTGEISPLRCDFDKMGLALCLTDTGGSHAELTQAFAQIITDMKSVAQWFGKELLGYVNPPDFFYAPKSDSREYLRAEHFFEENERVALMRQAIEAGDGQACIDIMNGSGRSSEQKLMNIYAENGDCRLGEGLQLSAELLSGKGAWRVHGGGFAGCVQALVPKPCFEEYQAAMLSRFGEGSCIRIM